MLNVIRRILLVFVGLTLLIGGLGTLSLFGYPMTLGKLSSALLLIFALLIWPITGRRLPRNRKHPAIIAFAVALAIGSAVSLTKGFPASQLSFIWTTFIAVVIFAFLIPYTVTSLRDLDILLLSLVFGGVFAVLGGEVLGLETVEETGRFAGTTANPNLLALALVCVLPVSFALLFSSSGGFRKLLLMAAILVETAGIVLSLSRAAFVSVSVMWSMWAWRFRRLDTIKYVVPVILLGVGTLYLAPSAFFERINTMSAEERKYDHSIQGRIIGSYLGLRAFLGSPLVGIGIRQAGIYIHEREPGIPPQHSIHNAYASIAAELGLMGMIPFALIILFSWRDYSLAWQTSRSPPYQDDPLLRRLAQRAMFLQIGFLGVLINAAFAPAVTSKAFWLLIGLSSAVVNLARMRVLEVHSHSVTSSGERVGSAETEFEFPSSSADPVPS